MQGPIPKQPTIQSATQVTESARCTGLALGVGIVGIVMALDNPSKSNSGVSWTWRGSSCVECSGANATGCRLGSVGWDAWTVPVPTLAISTIASVRIAKTETCVFMGQRLLYPCNVVNPVLLTPDHSAQTQPVPSTRLRESRPRHDPQP
jgi:hypothetical protein